MSTRIAKITGLIENWNKNNPVDSMTPNYDDNNLLLTAFYGGVNRGRCLQLTLENGQYIQMTVEEVQELIYKLNDFLHKNY